MDTGTQALDTYKMSIGGEWVEASSGETFETYNPYTAQPWALIPKGSAEDVNRAVEAAHKAFTTGDWPALNATQRGALLRRLGDLLTENADRLAEIEVRDNGKLIAEMSAQCKYLPQWYHYYGGLADKIEGSVIPIDKPGHFNYTLWEPLGVVAAITPWNSPLLLTTWKLAPALAAGNTVVVKPSQYTSASMLEFMKIFEQAGFPPGVVNVVTGFGSTIGMPLVEHPKVAKVAFTGSEETGVRVYEGAARGIKRVTMELGGKSPNIVFADADIDAAIRGASNGIFYNKGEVCTAGSRLFVEESLHDAFLDRLQAYMKKLVQGDPLNPKTRLGPQVSEAHMNQILGYVQKGKAEGARLVCGGERPAGRGYFVQPTVFDDVRADMTIAREEIFGPVLSVIRFKDLDDMLGIANDTPYGLAAGVWTRDIKKAHRVARKLQAGTVWINSYGLYDNAMPFGGYKSSGFGRELGHHGIMEYTQVKSVWVDLS